MDATGLTRDDFDHVVGATTRWSDNDMYGHLNNAVYYELFDSALNSWLIAEAGVEVLTLPQVGVVAESGCRFLRELAYPQPLEVAVRVERLGRTSITYTLGLFERDHAEPAAVGHWVHVYIDRQSRTPVQMPEQVRALLESAVASRGQ
jgi:acyl-CoA thioester hydrolase